MNFSFQPVFFPMKKIQYSSLRFQKFLGWLAFPILSTLIILLLKWIRRYEIQNLKEIRTTFKEIVSENRPILICPNHLTMIDSVIIQYALVSMWGYFLNYRLFAWNIPAKENFSSSIALRLITYLSKCIPIDRNGDEAHIQSVLSKADSLLKSNEPFLIFPEGKRSRTGKIEIEEVTYGVGKILQNIPDAIVVCIYLRGTKQVTYSTIPQKKDHFYLKLNPICPKTEAKGLRGQRELSLQIIRELKSMEENYEREERDICR